MKVIIAGGRHYGDFNEVAKRVSDSPFIIDEIVSGCASGADTLGEQYAQLHGIPVKQFPANWRKWGYNAGRIRNGQMAQYADALIHLPGGTGTTDMIRQAKQKGLHIYPPVTF